MAPSLATLHSTALSLLYPRDAASSLADARNTLSSWDSCMSKTYCKWPVIIVIIVGALIILSLLTCLFRCLCCGVECCCGCLSCCNACCPKPRGSSKKHKNQQYQPAPQHPQYNYPGNTAGPQPWHPQQQYFPPQPQHQDAMMYGANKALPEPHQQPPQPHASAVAVPQYARFSHPRGKGGEKATGDALPAMPSWNAAQERQVEDTSYRSPTGLNKESGGFGGEDGIPLQDRKQPGSAIQPSTFGTPEYEQGYKSPPLPLANEYSTGQHDGAAYGFVAAGLPSQHHQSQHPHQRQLSPPPQHTQPQYQQPYTNATTTTNGFHDPPSHPHQLQTQLQTQNPNYPSRTVSPISTISSPPHTQPLPQNRTFAPSSISQTPTSPTASSIYSTRPPPSYHTHNPNAPPSRINTGRREEVDMAPPMPSLSEHAYGGGYGNSSPQVQTPRGGYSMYNMAASEQLQQTAPPMPAMPSQHAGSSQQYQAYKPYQGSSAAELDGSRDGWR